MTTRTTQLLQDHEMRTLGFTDYVPGVWYLCTPVGPIETLNIWIEKRTGNWKTEIQEEYFCEPAYYGLYQEPFRSEIAARIDGLVRELNTIGLRVKVDHSEYGFQD